MPQQGDLEERVANLEMLIAKLFKVAAKHPIGRKILEWIHDQP